MTDMTVGSAVYPNPTTENAVLAIDADLSLLKNISVNIFDAQGKKVMEFNDIKENKVLINGHLPKGNYVYNVTSSKSLISTGKFIVQ